MEPNTSDFEDQATILVVDDRPDKLLALTTVLSELGTRLVCASSGTEALRLLLKHDYAVILLDVSMPDIDGFETAALIRQRKRTEYTPIIFITSINTNETHVTRGYSLGAVDYIFSPIQSEILKAKVGVFIELHNKNLQVKRQAELLRQQAEQRANSLENRLDELLNTLGVGVYRVAHDGKLLEANASFLKLLGFSTFEEAKESDLEQLYSVTPHPGRRSDNHFLKNGREQDQQWKDQEWIRRDGGTRIWLAITQTTVIEADGTESIQGLVDDVSRRKKAELELKALNDTLENKVVERTDALMVSQHLARRSERLASLGTLAAGIAHEINNPLNSILMSTDFALKRVDKPDIVKSTLETIANETRRCGKIVKGVLQFARDEKKAKDVNDLNIVVQSAVELARTYVKTPLTITLQVYPEPIRAILNPTEIEQIIINLIQNSVEANRNDRETRVGICVLTQNPGWASLLIEDNGPGIPEDLQMKIFDPFYTTKTDVGGTGLGLSVVHGIVNEHGGSITVRNNDSIGARFDIRIPLLDTPQLRHDSPKRNLKIVEKVQTLE